MQESDKPSKICYRCKESKPLSRYAVRDDAKRPMIRGVCRDCYNKRVRDQRSLWRKRVFDYYGWQCVCCGETIKEFLTIDHKDNDGYKDRMKKGWKRKLTSKDLYYQIVIKEGFPARFQTLCQNCNLGKLINNGICPHKKNGTRNV